MDIEFDNTSNMSTTRDYLVGFRAPCWYRYVSLNFGVDTLDNGVGRYVDQIPNFRSRVKFSPSIINITFDMDFFFLVKGQEVKGVTMFLLQRAVGFYKGVERGTTLDCERTTLNWPIEEGSVGGEIYPPLSSLRHPRNRFHRLRLGRGFFGSTGYEWEPSPPCQMLAEEYAGMFRQMVGPG